MQSAFWSLLQLCLPAGVSENRPCKPEHCLQRRLSAKTPLLLDIDLLMIIIYCDEINSHSEYWEGEILMRIYAAAGELMSKKFCEGGYRDGLLDSRFK